MNFSILEISRNLINQFRLEEVHYNVIYDSYAETFDEATEAIIAMLGEFHEKFSALMEEKDKISVTFFHNVFQVPIVIPFVLKADFTYELLEEVFFKVVQSYKYTIISDSNSLSAKVQIVRLPRGSGRRKLEESEKKPIKRYYVRKFIGPKLPKSSMPKHAIVEQLPIVKKIEKPFVHTLK